MEERRHPEFAHWFLRTFVCIWLLGAVSFVLVFALPAIGLDGLGPVAVAVFVFALAGGLAYMAYRLFHVACPGCGLPCRTRQSDDRETWVATCDGCQVRWQLGVGSNGSDP